MTAKSALLITGALILFTLLLGAYFYPILPSVMASHWDASGAVNGTMSKSLGITLVPLLMLVLGLLAFSIPRIDPLRSNIAAFRRQYYTLVVLIELLLAGIQVASIAENLGAAFNMMVVVMPLVGFLFLYLGFFLPQTRRNFFIGIRTPWTISSDEVWDRTHRLGGLFFKILGALAIATLLAPGYAIIAFIAPLCVVVVGLVAYSYVIYREVETRRISM